MPKSKKPRKKGQFGRKSKATSFFVKHYKNLDAVSDRIEKAEKDFASFAKGADKINFLCSYTSEKLRNSQIRDFIALDRLPSTYNPQDVRQVASTITIAILLTDLIDLTPESHAECNQALQFGLYMSVMALRMRAYDKQLPEANLQPIHDALNVAQDLICWAFDNDRAKLLTARRANNEAREGLAAIRRDQRTLGKYWERVREWAQADLEHFSKTNPELMPPINTIHAPASWVKDLK